MKDLKSITEDYRQSDSERRLYLFLDCPSLRNEFIRIDREEMQAGHTARPESEKVAKQSGFRNLFATLKHGWSTRSI